MKLPRSVHVLINNPRLAAGLAIIVLFVIASASGPSFVKWDPIAIDLEHVAAGPGAGHLLGTDELGRDVLSRILYGGRLTLILVVSTVAPATVVGILLGLVAGYFGGAADIVIMRLSDMLIGFPGLLLALTVVSILGPSVQNIVVAMAIYLIPRVLRVTRGTALGIAREQYVEAARSSGTSRRRILLLHILPNCSSTIATQFSYDMGSIVLLVSGLSFLGLGPTPPTPEWGLMLNDSLRYLLVVPLLPLAPGICIFSLVFGFNLLGDGLRDVLDPRGALNLR